MPNNLWRPAPSVYEQERPSWQRRYLQSQNSQSYGCSGGTGFLRLNTAQAFPTLVCVPQAVVFWWRALDIAANLPPHNGCGRFCLTRRVPAPTSFTDKRTQTLGNPDAVCIATVAFFFMMRRAALHPMPALAVFYLTRFSYPRYRQTPPGLTKPGPNRGAAADVGGLQQLARCWHRRWVFRVFFICELAD